jgi:hypothetical protein
MIEEEVTNMLAERYHKIGLELLYYPCKLGKREMAA